MKYNFEVVLRYQDTGDGTLDAAMEAVRRFGNLVKTVKVFDGDSDWLYTWSDGRLHEEGRK
jgi:ketosteroid isomerase-like protein